MKFCTRTISNFVLSLCLLFLGTTTTLAQNGQFDVRFTIKNFDCANNKVTILLQVKAHDAAHTFVMGDANYRFDYDPRVIKNPAITSQENFSNQAPSSDLNYVAQNLNGSSVGTTLGTVSLNTIYGGGGLGGKLVPATWTNVSCIRFDVQDATKCFDLVWHDDTRFPITGMNEIVLSGQNDGNYDAYVVAAGGVFQNYSQCTPSVCSGMTAIDDINATNKNTPVSGNAATNDVSLGGATTYTLLSQTAGGTLVLNPDGTYTDTPTTDFVGEHKATYQVCNAAGLCDTATIVVQILDDVPIGTNSAPLAQNDNAQTTVNVPVTGSVLTNDLEPNGNTLTVTTSPITSPTNGGVVINPDGTFTYTPTNGFVGQDTFRYQVCDNGTPSLCDTAMVVLVVGIDNNGTSNNPPNAQDDSKTTTRNTAVIVPVKGNDTDPNGNTLGNPSIGTNPTNGSIVINGDGTITYTPNNNYIGPDRFTYSVCDNGTPTLCDTATVYIDVTKEANVPPVITETPITTPEDSTKTICIAVTDANIGQVLSATLCSGYPKNGTAGAPSVSNGQVCFSFTPTPNYNGVDTICLIVCDNGNPSLCDTAKIPVTITPVNDVPVVTETPVTVKEDSTITICETITDPDAGDTFTATLCSQPAHGLAGTPIVNGNQVCVQYSPTANYNGTDTVCLIVCDQAGKCDTSKIPVTITPVEDAPVVTETPVTVKEDSTITICQTITDPDAGDTFTATLCSQPAHGLAGTPIVNGNQVCVQYSPTANFYGTDTICIIICDQTGKCDTSKTPVTVTPVPDPPVVTEVPVTVPEDSTITICQTITDPDAGDTFTASLCSQPAHGLAGTPIVNGNQVCVQYSPTANYNGTDTVCIIVCDQTGRCDTAKVPVTVTSKPDAPVVTEVPVTVPEDSTITICQTITDPDAGDTFSASLCSQPAHGLAGTPIVNGNQVCVQYSPAANYNGTDTVCIIICDQTGKCDTAKVPVTITPVADKPVVTETPVIVPEDSTITICQTITDPDAGDTFTASLCSQPAHGLAGTPIVNGNQVCVQYSPTANYNGTDTVCIIVCDQTGKCDTSKVPVTITPVEDKPVVTEVPVTVPEDSTITICQTITDPDAGDTFTASLCSQPAHGLAGTPIVNGNQVCVQYSPTANYNGTDTVCIIVCDQTGRCDTSKVPVTVTPVTDAPVVTETPVTVKEDSTITICQTITDPDAGDTFTATLCSQPAHGLAGTPVVNGNQVCVQYVPTANYNGTDTVCIIVCDQTGKCDTSKTPLTITPVNDKPDITGTTVVTSDKTPVTVCLPITDPDAGDTFTPSLCGTPAAGVVGTPVITNGQICVQYLPTANASVGTQTICVQVCDAAGLCDTAHITIHVTPTNQAPVATNDINNTIKNTPTNGTVLVNDIDPDFNTLTASLITPAQHGILTLNPNGTYTYVPVTGFIGTDSAFYKVCDNGVPSLCDTAMVVIEIREPNNGNQDPIANNDNSTTPANHPVVVAVTSNDYDPDNGQTISHPSLVGTPVGGTPSVNPDGTVTFTPTTGFIGDASFKYKICDNGTPSLCDTATAFIVVYADPTLINVAPIAVDDANSTTGTTPVSGTVATNDTDPNVGQTLTYTGLGDGAKGTATVNPDGTYTYTPNANTSGWDEFSYKVCDNGTPTLCDTAIVSIFVNEGGSVRPNSAPIATPDNPVTNTGTPVTINVKSNDYDPNGDALTIPTITTPPTCGAAVVNADGTITFTPNTGFTGVCTFIYQVCDTRTPAMCDTALVSVKVDPLPISNRPPVAINDGYVAISGQNILAKSVAMNDSDPDAGQTLSFTQLTFPTKGIVSFDAAGLMTYYPLATFIAGRDSFKYKVCDNGTPSLCDTAWVFVEYTANPAANVPPIALDDNAGTTTGTKVNIPVKTNDGDPNGVSSLAAPSVLAQPSCGTATVLPNGTIDFTPTTGFVGDCSFRYILCDTGTPALCDTATITVTVVAPIVTANRAPIAQNDATTTPVSTPVNGTVASNDSDLDAGQTLTFSKLANPTNGAVVVNTDGTYTYTPTTGFVGRDSFTYRVCDNGSPVLCTTATAVIVVTAAGVNENDKPVAEDDKTTTTPSTPVTINVKANDIDPDGSANTLTNPVVIGTPVGGTPSVNPDGTVTFTPTTGFVGTATFTYRVCDNGSPSLCDTAVVTITVKQMAVNNINLPPVAIDDAKSGYKNETITGTTGLNDSDPNAGQTLTYAMVSQPTSGLVTTYDALTGNFAYTPISNYVGADYFVYSICDNGSPSLCDTAVAYLTILDNPCVTVQLKAFIEGPYSTATGKMKTVLNQRGLLPGQSPVGQFAVKTAAGHPYKGAPWNYTGTEGDTITSYPSTVVDWVLVSLRSTASTLVPAWRCAAWLHEDGSITIPGKPCVQIPNGSYFIVIEHRNHIGVMSPAAVTIANNTLNFDFSAGESFILTNPPSFGQKTLSNGVRVMYAGDGKKDTQNTNFDINFNDSQLWKLQSGIFDQYRYGDFNLDADVNFSDQVLWKANNGRYSGVPH